MFYPNRQHEFLLSHKGFHSIAGIDEAGRGAWAGPLVAAAVILDPQHRIKGIKDSKKLRSPDRQRLYELITARAKAWAVGIIPEQTIDEIGIGQVNLRAMEEAVRQLAVRPDFLLVDFLPLDHLPIPSQSIIRGDHKVTSIAAASIVAKVTRDLLMDQLSQQYPQYGFSHHKGYGTNHHHHMLMEFGPCPIHRRSFEPMKTLLEIGYQPRQG